MPNPRRLRPFAIFFAVTLLALSRSAGAAEDGGASLDASVRAAGEKALGARLQIQCYLDPCARGGDFDGDGRPDQAVLVSDQKNRRGIAVIFGSGTSALLGAGHPIGNGGDNFRWADEWEVVPKGAKRRRDALLVTSESGGGLLSWASAKKGFLWRQWGD